ncbi:hypothetical protein ACFLTA_06485 [Bacteroidota bacterium]
MKKAMILLCLLASSTILIGQRSYIGLQAGFPTISWLGGNIEDKTIRWNLLNPGLSGKIGLTERMDIRVEARMAFMGAWINFPETEPVDEKIKFKYFQFPMLLSFEFYDGFTFQFGGYYGKLYKAKWYNVGDKASSTFVAVVTAGIVDDTDKYIITDWCNLHVAGFLIGIGYQGYDTYLGIRYQHGLQNNFKSGNYTAYNRGLEIIWEVNPVSIFRK